MYLFCLIDFFGSRSFYYCFSYTFPMKSSTWLVF